MSYDGTRYDLPAVVAFGASWSDAAHGVRVNADLESPSHYYQAVRVGGEWMWRGQVALRAGYRSDLGGATSERLSGPTFGLGTGVGTMWMDYGFAVNGADGSGQHRIGITFRPGMLAGEPVAARPIAAPTPRAPKPVKVATREPERSVEPKAAKPAKSAKVEATKSEAVPKSDAAKAADPTLTPGPMPVMPPAPAPAEPATPPAAVTPAPASPSPAPAPAPQERPTTVTLAHGETLADLAKRWDTSVPAIMMVNNLVSERVQPGTKLKLPPPNRR
jgi:LysM repeat protein